MVRLGVRQGGVDAEFPGHDARDANRPLITSASRDRQDTAPERRGPSVHTELFGQARRSANATRDVLHVDERNGCRNSTVGVGLSAVCRDPGPVINVQAGAAAAGDHHTLLGTATGTLRVPPARTCLPDRAWGRCGCGGSRGRKQNTAHGKCDSTYSSKKTRFHFSPSSAPNDSGMNLPYPPPAKHNFQPSCWPEFPLTP